VPVYQRYNHFENRFDKQNFPLAWLSIFALADCIKLIYGKQDQIQKNSGFDIH
jgi:hypothetical protein